MRSGDAAVELPRLYAKPLQVHGGWSWILVTDPADWLNTVVLDGPEHRSQLSPTREAALAQARAWASQRGEYVGDLP